MVCVCPLHRGVSSLVSHATRWSSLLGLVRSGGSLSLLNTQCMDRLSSHPPLHSSVLLGHGMCDSHTLTLLLTGSHCSVSAWEAFCTPRCFFDDPQPLPTLPACSHMHDSHYLAHTPTDEQNHGRDLTSIQAQATLLHHVLVLPSTL
jgi:hypothetical protein